MIDESSAVAVWLKTTIPGLIVLGVIGSIAALLVIRVIAVIYKSVVPPTTRAYLRRRLVRHYTHGFFMGSIAAGQNWLPLHIWVAYHLMRFLVGLIASAISVMILLYLLDQRGVTLSRGTLTATIVALVSAYFAYREFWHLQTAYEYLVRPILTQAAQLQGGKGEEAPPPSC